MMKLTALAVVLLVSCGKGKEAGTSDPAPASGMAGAPAPGSPGSAPSTPSVKGELVVAGAVNGTFHWKDDLALRCGWIADLKSGALEATMTDGKDTFLSYEQYTGKDRNEIIFTSGALKGAGSLKGSTGFTMDGSADGKRLTLSVDSQLASADGAVKTTIKGKLEAACP